MGFTETFFQRKLHLLLLLHRISLGSSGGKKLILAYRMGKKESGLCPIDLEGRRREETRKEKGGGAKRVGAPRFASKKYLERAEERE